MKKHILTGVLVAASAGLLIYTAFYNKGLNGGVASKHQNNMEFKNFTPTTQNNQYKVFSRLVNNQAETAVVDNTGVVNAVTGFNTNQDNTTALQADLKQPLSLANVDFAEFSISAGSAQTIRNNETGTTLSIKPNSFVNEYGEVAEGTVNVFMREMHTAPEFFMRGLPMNGYESAGVLELKATDEAGQPIYLTNDKPVEVLLASNVKGSNYSVYALGESTKSWQLKKSDVTYLKTFTEKKKKANEYDTNISLAPLRKGIHVFKKELRFKTYLNYRAYPEMQAYSDVEWVYTGSNVKKVYTSLMKDRTNPYNSRRAKSGLLFNYWTDVKLSKDSNGELHMVFTSGGEEALDITVKPEHVYGQNINADNMYDEYQLALNNKKSIESKEVKDLEQEARETFDPATLPTGYTSLTRFTIDEMGIWGLHQTLTYSQQASFAITFTDMDGQAINSGTFYQYDKALNTYQAITPSQLFSMGYNGYTNSILFAVTGANEVAILNGKGFDDLVARSTAGYPLIAKLTRMHVNSAADVKALFNS